MELHIFKNSSYLNRLDNFQTAAHNHGLLHDIT